MIHFLPAKQVTAEPVTLSLHGKLNESMKSLGVVCTGAAGGTLYFDRQSKQAKAMPLDQLADAIIKIITSQPDVVDWMRRTSTTDISIR
jgi:hypothetical protein